MENLEASVSSTATRTWHDFWERMRQPSATEFVKMIKKFIVSKSNDAPDPEIDALSVQEFYSKMEANFRAHPLWASRTEEELESASEGLEKHIMTKLYPRVFAAYPDDVKTDNEFNKKSTLVQQFIHPDHLEIQPIYQNETSWLQAQEELLKINTYKAPRDKLACILSCCKAISNSMFNASVSSNQNPPGADDFFPVLIYVTIKANPPQFHSNLMYIERYRNKSRLIGETAYVFTNMLSAESFILNIDAKALSMNETDFMKNMKFAEIVVSGLSGDYNGENVQTQSSQMGQSQSVSVSKLKEVPSVSDLENKGAITLEMEEKAREKSDNFRYLYSKAGDLTVGDVEDLLNSYRQLVIKYVCLAKGMGVPLVHPQASETQTSGETREAETVTGGGAENAYEVEGSMRFDGEKQMDGEMVDAPESDTQVDAGRIKSDQNDGVGGSTLESTGEAASLEDNVEKIVANPELIRGCLVMSVSLSAEMPE